MPPRRKLHLRFGTVGRAGALALARVLAPVVLVATPVALARVQTFAGVLFDIFFIGTSVGLDSR